MEASETTKKDQKNIKKCYGRINFGKQCTFHFSLEIQAQAPTLEALKSFSEKKPNLL